MNIQCNFNIIILLSHKTIPSLMLSFCHAACIIGILWASELHMSDSQKKDVIKVETFPLMNNMSTIPELHNLERKDGGEPVRIIKRIGPNYAALAAYLLDDDHGVELDTIKANAEDVVDINRRIFTSWLALKGKAATWGTLVQALRKQSQLNGLADDIVSALQTYKGHQTD